MPTFTGGGSWISPFGQNNATVTPVVGELYVAPFIVPAACQISALALQLSNTPSVDAIARLMVFGPAGSGFAPGAIVYDSGALGGSIPSGPLVSTGTFSLAAGINFAGYVFTTGATLTSVVQVAKPPAFRLGNVYYGSAATPNVANGNDGSVFKQTGVAGAVSTFTGSYVGNSNAPNQAGAIMFRVV